MEKILAIITARGGSKGLPGKNTKTLSGKPLIVHTIDRTLALKEFLYDVLVSTDDSEIAEISKQAGASVPFLRPKHLATDEASSLDVAMHAIDFIEKKDKIKIDWLLILQPTTPLRTQEDIYNSIHLTKSGKIDTVVSVYEKKHIHPLKMKKIDNDGYLSLFLSESSWQVRRQDLNPAAYLTNGGIYLTKRDVVMNGSLIGKHVKPYIMPINRSIDIDDEVDFLLAEILMNKQMGLLV